MRWAGARGRLPSLVTIGPCGYLYAVYLDLVSCCGVAIQSFADPQVEEFYLRGRVPREAGWASVAKVAARKLDMLDYAHRLYDLRSPPGNRLEALKGRLAGSYSVRINDQWRVVFRWTEAGPAEVDIVDYH